MEIPWTDRVATLENLTLRAHVEGKAANLDELVWMVGGMGDGKLSKGRKIDKAKRDKKLSPMS